MTKVLVLGTPGQLGHELMRGSWPGGLLVSGVGYPDFDVGKEADVRRVMIEHAPDIAINATAYTAVDKAEGNRDTAFTVNRDGPFYLAKDCAERNIPLIHISTDYVFDGTKPGCYVEDDPINPLNVYGESKAAGEAMIRKTLPRHVILRTTWLYAAHGANFVKTMLRLGREREALNVVADQYGAPTAAADLASAVIAVAGHIASHDGEAPWGTYHVTNAGETTWHGFAEQIFQRLERETGRRPLLAPIATSDYPTPARRPTNSRLDGSKFKVAFGIVLPGWEDSLEKVLDELLTSSR